VNTETTAGLAKVEVVRYDETGQSHATGEYVPSEQEFTVSINGEYETSLFCAPHRVKSLVIGYLVGEGLLENEREFVAIDTDLHHNLVRATVSPEAASRLSTRALTGPFGRLAEPEFARKVDSALSLKPEAIQKLAASFKRLFLSLKSSEKMCYLAAFAQHDEILSYGEGFHRVNAVYRALGELIASGVKTESRIALCNFGLTKQITLRLARAGVAFAITAAPPSNAAIELANASYLSICTTAIGGQLSVYSSPWRVL
jgi:formate dehydrogenase accessory protein FdhD